MPPSQQAAAKERYLQLASLRSSGKNSRPTAINNALLKKLLLISKQRNAATIPDALVLIQEVQLGQVFRVALEAQVGMPRRCAALLPIKKLLAVVNLFAPSVAERIMRRGL